VHRHLFVLGNLPPELVVLRHCAEAFFKVVFPLFRELLLKVVSAWMRVRLCHSKLEQRQQRVNGVSHQHKYLVCSQVVKRTHLKRQMSFVYPHVLFILAFAFQTINKELSIGASSGHNGCPSHNPCHLLNQVPQHSVPWSRKRCEHHYFIYVSILDKHWPKFIKALLKLFIFSYDVIILR
jgi:hypothetical protein